MDKIYFHIYKGKPLSQEDNREEIPELPPRRSTPV